MKGLQQEIKRIKQLLAHTDSTEQKRRLTEDLEQAERQLDEYQRHGEQFLF